MASLVQVDKVAELLQQGWAFHRPLMDLMGKSMINGGATYMEDQNGLCYGVSGNTVTALSHEDVATLKAQITEMIQSRIE